MDYTPQFSVVWNNLGLFAQGIFLTLQIVVVAIACGLPIGIAGALGRTSHNRLLNWLATAYVEFFRNTPFLIQLFFFFFGLPSIGVRMSSWQAAVLALAINFGAYATEIMRAGIEGIDHSQIEAGMALGFNKMQIFRHVILVPALGKIYPALVSQIVIAVLFSSVVSQISAEELTFVGNFLQSRTFRSFEIYLAISLMYVGLVWVIKLIAYGIQQKFFAFTKYIR
ncbi:amino acid ABC transporter permease [Spirulina major CS-329]|jgi:polar amino acid transport system permease protein|uniref:amino acid ABC transporter permease n=1 Tax=Spirulina TaxID=1154 RepID=UPI00232D7A3B|nr:MULTISPECIES: amino acid ABC transporter permease [Spirulina]MDB9494150.1 amino acid ABC transporter permease [Spirulina subsalsa CS-330]MDB9502386.1 amino acid ABC transporter permease [Spirulina major CS-329]